MALLSCILVTLRYLVYRFKPLKRTLLCIFIPLLFSPIYLFINTREGACCYVVAIMGFFWVTETLPLPVTGLIPLFAYPLLSVSDAESVSSSYFKDSNFVFFGSMIMAAAVESSRLHERIALNTLIFTGPNPRWLLLGFLFATGFISMWISNTACTMMMVPIVVAVIKELDVCHRRQNDADAKTYPEESGEIIDMKNTDKKQIKIFKALLLGIAYSSTIGGTSTIIGTGANVVLNGYLTGVGTKYYPDNTPVTFGAFMIYAFPQAFILIIICWLWLVYLFIGFKKHDTSNDDVIKQVLVKKHQMLGPIRYEEKTILVAFGILIFLWMTRDIPGFTGWGKIFMKKYVKDGTTTMFMAILLFILPAENPLAQKTVEDFKPGEQIRTIMTWKEMRDKFSWSTLFLLGGGFAMAGGVEKSRLSYWMGQKMAAIGDDVPNWGAVAIACALVTLLTEFTSNIATATVFINVSAEIAIQRCSSPLYYLIPITFSSSFAFMFPAGTPPNAIVFSVRILRVTDMILGGVILNIASFVVCQIFTQTVAPTFFDMSPFPCPSNATTLVPTH